MTRDEDQSSERPPRADSVRNRARLLEAARSVFNQGGPGASLERVAQQAGVGTGTLYRHFPTREAMFDAVYRHEVDQLIVTAAELGSTLPPVDALREWLHAIVAFVATKKGMSAALAVVIHNAADLNAYSLSRLTAAGAPLLQRAVAAGAIRGDVSADDLLRTTIGLCYTHDKPGWQGNVCRLADVFMDGLRVRGSGIE